MPKKNILIVCILALVALFVNIIYCLLMWAKNGGAIPLLFKPDTKIDNDQFFRRRLFGIEFWVSFTGFVIVLVSLLSYL
tara:strand:- start:255 stop:491 length:237 start_codon:yes stop_codon:yes gene_type:complete